MKTTRLVLLLMIAVSCAPVSCAHRPFFKASGAALPPHSGTVEVLTALPDSSLFIEIGSFYAGRVAVNRAKRTIENARRISAENGADALVILENRKKTDVEYLYYGEGMMLPTFDSYFVFRAKAVKRLTPFQLIVKLIPCAPVPISSLAG
jgi:hypothetical protein